MSFCRYGDRILPKFYIYRTFDSRLNISVLGERQELRKVQVKCLIEILLTWIIRGVLEGWLEAKGARKTLRGWKFSTRVDERGRKILIIEFPNVDMLLTLGEGLRLKRVLENYLKQIL